MKRVQFTNGRQKFWVSDPNKLKYWENMSSRFPKTSIRKLKEVKE